MAQQKYSSPCSSPAPSEGFRLDSKMVHDKLVTLRRTTMYRRRGRSMSLPNVLKEEKGGKPLFWFRPKGKQQHQQKPQQQRAPGGGKQQQQPPRPPRANKKLVKNDNQGKSSPKNQQNPLRNRLRMAQNRVLRRVGSKGPDVLQLPQYAPSGRTTDATTVTNDDDWSVYSMDDETDDDLDGLSFLDNSSELA